VASAAWEGKAEHALVLLGLDAGLREILDHRLLALQR
jgi:hypothetical protein